MNFNSKSRMVRYGLPLALFPLLALSSAFPMQQAGLTQVVRPTAPAETLTISQPIAVVDSSVQFVARVTGVAGVPGIAQPTGMVSFTLTPSDGSTSLTTAIPLVNGVSTWTTVVAQHVIGYTVTAVYSGDTNYVSQTASAAGSIVEEIARVVTISGAPATATAGTAFSFSATVLDTTGNVDASYTGTLHFSSTDGNAVLPRDTTLTAGQGTFTATLRSPGLQVLTAADTVNSNVSGSSPAITVSLPNLVVTTFTDDAGTASNCTPQTIPGTGSDQACSLRDALLNANNAGGATISFASSLFATAQTLTLGNGPMSISQSVTITGPGATLLTISGANSTSLFYVKAGASANMSGLTLANGAATASSPSGGQGGAFYDAGSVILANTVLSGNTATSNGGAIAVASGGTLQITNTTLSGNSSTGGNGGAISTGLLSVTTLNGVTLSGNTAQLSGGAIANTGQLSLINSTVSGNTASTQQGGGIYSSAQNASVGLLQSTVVGNTAATQGGGIFLSSGTLTLHNSLAAQNSASSYPDIDAVSGTYSDGGGNVADTANSSVVGNALMTPLGNYGGATQTLLPVPSSSSVICAGTLANVGSLTTDQRGLPRTTIYGGKTCVDAGATESNYSVAFVQQPASSAVNTVLTPPPTVQMSESGIVWDAVSVPLSISSAFGTLSGSTSQNTSATGLAAFSGLSIAQIETNDTLTATLALSAQVNTIATSQPFNVLLLAPTLTFAAIPPQTYGNAPFSVTASSASSGALTYAVVSGPATVAGNTVTITGTGRVVLSASQAASGNYAAATATTSFTVVPGVPTLAFAPVSVQTFTVTSFAVSATSASSGAISYTVVSGPATIQSNMVTLTAAGTVVLSASQAASGNYAAATATTSFTTTAAITLTIAPGAGSSSPNSNGSAAYPFAVSPGGSATYPDAITFSASGLPPGATATFTPDTLPAGSTLTVVTMNIQMSTQALNRTPFPIGPSAPIVLGALLLPWIALKRVRRRLPTLLAALLLFVGATVGMSGCGAANGFRTGSAGGPTSYAIVITATDTVTGSKASTTVDFMVP
jgi:predicted outer membrane repeat protein